MFSLKVVLFLSVAIAAVMAEEVPVVGGVKQLSGDDLKAAEEALKNSLTKLAAGDGPTYKLSKINSASHQVVSGSLYKYNVDLIDSNEAVKKCDVSIWSQPWLENGIEVSFECEGAEKVVKKHSA